MGVIKVRLSIMFAFIESLLQPMHLLVIGLIAILLFGKRLPEIARSLGKSMVEFKKGAACVIDFPQRVAAGKGVLYGHFQPSHLRKLS